ncbi:MAG: hypothetical protein Q9227_003277 [Pyrenula ochraceoflavens]
MHHSPRETDPLLKPGDGEQQQQQQQQQPAYSVLTTSQRALTVTLVALAALFSPVSSAVYFPALGTLADELHVPLSLINLTVTVYLVMQGLSPSLVGSWSDSVGRRPLYIICFAVYIGSSVGLALQSTYPALLVLRMVQSCAGSPMPALAQAVVADFAISAERGRYTSYVSSGALLGPALGPLIGGLLIHRFDWRATFWFLAIFASLVFVLILAFLPETCRAIVDRGQLVPPTWLHSSLTAFWHSKGQIRVDAAAHRGDDKPPDRRKKAASAANPIESLRVIKDPETGLVLLYAAFILAGYQVVSANISEELYTRRQFSTLQVGLCFLPFGMGAFLSALTTGHIVDWNFRRLARIHGWNPDKGRQQDLSQFPIEKARLQVGMPIVGIGALSIAGYGWAMEKQAPIALPLVCLFVVGWIISSSVNSVSVLIVDLHLSRPATATAANNLVRCLMGALAVACMGPVIERIGIGWTATTICALYICLLPLLLVVWIKGPAWRRTKEAAAD